MTFSLRNIAQLLSAAKAAKNPEEAERWVAAAAAQAAQEWDWGSLLADLPPSLSLESRRKVAIQAVTYARQHRHIYLLLTVAALQDQELHDPAAARETLETAERLLLEKASTAPVAALRPYFAALAEGFLDIARDNTEARRAFDLGWDFAWSQQDVVSLCGMVRLSGKLFGPEDAIMRLMRVERAALEWDNAEQVIDCWRSLGRLDEMRRAQYAAVDRTNRFEVALKLADFAHGAGAFARAEELARTASDWFNLSQRAFDDLDDKALSRRALDRAAECVDSIPLKARIASAYADWFEDDIAADRVGPQGVHPDYLRPRQRRFEGWESSAADLFDWIRARMTPEILREVAKADYGEDVDLHFSALDRICKTGLVPLELRWYPGEVVRLMRWSTGLQSDGEHLQRAFSCILLSMSPSDDDDFADIAPQMVESCNALGAEATSAAERFLVWLYETSDDRSGGNETAVIPLLLLLLLRAGREPGDHRLADLLRTMDQAGALGLRERIASSMRAVFWAQMIDAQLMPLHSSHPQLSPLLDAIGFPRERP